MGTADNESMNVFEWIEKRADTERDGCLQLLDTEAENFWYENSVFVMNDKGFI